MFEPTSLVFILTVALLLLRAPIFVVLGTPAIYYLWSKGIPLALAPQRLIGTVNESILLAVPMFMLAGRLMNQFDATTRIFDLAQALVGHIRGGLGFVAVKASMIFSAMSGSAAADAVGVGTITVRAMKDRGYDPSFAAAVTLSSATLAPVVPPSIIMIIYGASANVSIGKLFVGGVLPGLLMSSFLLLTVAYLSWRRQYPKGEAFCWRRLATAFSRSLLVLMTPIIIIGGIFTGLFTPTEASVVAVVYVLLLGLVYRKIEWKTLYQTLLSTGTAVGALMLVVSISGLDAWVIAREQIPQLLAASVTELTDSKTVVMLLILAVVLFLGLFMDATPIILMLVPAVMPLVTAFQIDPIHLGVLFCIMCVVGLITPPVGIALYGVAMVSNLPIERVFWASLPFFVMLLLSLGLMLLVPQIITFLPNLLIS
ncbi:ABC transporter permease [Marinobacterium nitratireducens]|uniref:TRAP transporter large permease protein n=1 Tax=Marinobacterium nitratireducens TaxID=518897 RepID=A0A917ZIB9_9GAMM|nr:TRAP transporter large permease [Marinobacterium nitratireducens]GGO83859.1 ABC transporter permease [Marinobacterium nitratireducens]